MPVPASIGDKVRFMDSYTGLEIQHPGTYTDAEADMVLQTRDGTRFRVHFYVLKAARYDAYSAMITSGG